MHESSKPTAQASVLWVIWLSLIAAIVFYQFKLGGGWLHGGDAHAAWTSPVVWVAVGLLLTAAAIRWLLLPHVRRFRPMLILLVVGLSLSEAVEFFGLFLLPRDLPATKMALFVLALASTLQFAPFYARKLALAQS